MADILAFALNTRLHAAHFDARADLPARKDVSYSIGPFRWHVDPDSGKLVCRFDGGKADEDPLPLCA